jgi:hypothetical protein
MGLNHFKAKHFGSKTLSLLGHISDLIQVVVEWLVIARRRGKR